MTPSQSGVPAPAHPPETLEGWYALHQVFAIDRSAIAERDKSSPIRDTSSVQTTRGEMPPASAGWTAFTRLIGSRADVMAIHFRSTLDEIGDAQRAAARLPGMSRLHLVYSFLSVTEAGLYHLSAQLAREATERGGAVGDERYATELRARRESEGENPHVKRRLYPTLPEGMPYICFYPMSKRRAVGQNWYALTLDERSRLMQAHGATGRRYAGRVLQVITGAIGFDAWEWGVTLFAKDPLDFKKLITEMRFDEVSAKYAEFGEFFVGRLVSGGER